MKLLICSRYQRLGASSRLRSIQFIPFFESVGIEVEVQALFSDSYVRDLQQGRRSLLRVLVSYWRRYKRLRTAMKQADVLLIEKELFPGLPVRFEQYLLAKHGCYILDYDDAVFHLYDDSPRMLVRKLLSKKYAILMQSAFGVSVGNQYLADYAAANGADNIHIFPTVVDLARYPFPKPLVHQRVKNIPKVGWIGQLATAHFLTPLRSLVSDLSGQQIARFFAIGVDMSTLDFAMEFLPWSEATEVEALQDLDIGIMPLFDAPFERGKCGYKLIQYMACGLPVIASPIGVNCEIVEHGVNGYLAETEEEWRIALTRLINDPELRVRMGLAGRQKVEQYFSLQVVAPQIVALLNQAAAGESF